MKYLNLILIALCLCFTACNSNDEPIPNSSIPIYESYLPGNVIFEVNDTEFRDKIKGWNNEMFIVNSLDELPNDPLGLPESFSKINFTDKTLLVYYNVHTYDIVAYESQIIKNNTEGQYDWIIRLVTSGDLNYSDEIERMAITRYAILIPKTSVTISNLRVIFSVYDHDWDK